MRFRIIVEMTSDCIGDFGFQFLQGIRLGEYAMSDGTSLEATLWRFLIDKK